MAKTFKLINAANKSALNNIKCITSIKILQRNITSTRDVLRLCSFVLNLPEDGTLVPKLGGA